MTIQEVSLQLLAYIGVYSLDPTANTNESNQRGLQAGDLMACIVAINAALQEIYKDGPVALSERRLAMSVYLPSVVTMHVTQYSQTITVTGFQSWMEGCTVQCGAGDPIDNEILSSTTLLRPYMGPTDTISGTVYCDSFRLPSNIKNVMEPIDFPSVSIVRVAGSREDFRFWNMSTRYGDRPALLGESAYLTTNKSVGDPRVYLVEGMSDGTSATLPIYLRVNPMPQRSMSVTMRIQIKPPQFTVADIGDASSVVVSGTLAPDVAGTYASLGTDVDGYSVYYKSGTPISTLLRGGGAWVLGPQHGDDVWIRANVSPFGTYAPDGAGSATGTATVTASGGGSEITIPTDWHESILLPLAKKRFMSHASFDNGPAAAQINEDYRLAKLELASFAPQIAVPMAQYQ